MNPNNPYTDGPDAAASGYEPEDARNPYYGRDVSPPMADLDANAPSLRNAEAQRLNRKALGFLAAIVVLLVLMATWVFAGARGGDARKAAHQDSEEVRIPDLPQASPGAARPGATAAMPGGYPTDASAVPTQAELPPLPPAQPVPLSSNYPPPPGSRDHPVQAHRLTLLERRMENVDSSRVPAAQSAEDTYMQAMLATMPGAKSAAQGAAAGAGESAAAHVGPGAARFLEHPDALLVRGTYIRCVLETHIVSDIPGFTSCIVTEPVYSINGQSLLLPKGSKVLGRYDDTPTGPRMAVVWDRLITPTGIDVEMASPGVDALGGSGHPGDYDAHWASRVSSALMISLLSDAFKYAAAKNGPATTVSYGTNVTQMPFDSNTARTVQGLADQALRASASRSPTVTINQGTVVNIYVARDVDFSSVLARR